MIASHWLIEVSWKGHGGQDTRCPVQAVLRLSAEGNRVGDPFIIANVVLIITNFQFYVDMRPRNRDIPEILLQSIRECT